MGTKLATDRGDTLYDFWDGIITDQLNADLAESPGPPVVVNLASGEYARAVDLDALEGEMQAAAEEASEGDDVCPSFL